MRLYLDSDVWITLFDRTDARHGIVLELFEKIEKENILVVISPVHIKEIERRGHLKKFEEKAKAINARIVETIEGWDAIRASKMNKKLGLGRDDCLHMIITEKMGAIPVSYDEHWEKIGEVMGIKVFIPGQVLKL
ncbi:MAG: PIN domain-containing protein [Candidatus Micrarchaeota archaeon]